MIITSGKYKGRKIQVPPESITRPTLSKVRMAVFNTLQAVINFEGKSFLDMYAGSGIMGLEALSRGFEKAVAIEKNPKVVGVLKTNFAKFDSRPKLYVGDSLNIINKIDDFFDVVYIDPPYFAGIYEKSLQALNPCEIVILEHVEEVDFVGFELIKQKKYADKYITFLRDCRNKK